MKEGKGIFQQMQESMVTASNASPTKEKLIEVFENLVHQSTKPIVGPTIFMSSRMYGYSTALINDDKEEILRYETIFAKERFADLKRDHLRIQSYGETVYNAFCEIEAKYGNYRGHGVVHWHTERIEPQNEEVVSGRLEVYLDEISLTFTIKLEQYGDYDYFEPSISMLWSRIAPENIIYKINQLTSELNNSK